MPFQSEKQRRYLHANHPEIAKRWERDYAGGGLIPSHEAGIYGLAEGGNIRLQPHTASDLLVQKTSSGERPKYQPPGHRDAPAPSDRGPRDDPDRFGPTTETKTTTTDTSTGGEWSGDYEDDPNMPGGSPWTAADHTPDYSGDRRWVEAETEYGAGDYATDKDRAYDLDFTYGHKFKDKKAWNEHNKRNAWIETKQLGKEMYDAFKFGIGPFSIAKFAWGQNKKKKAEIEHLQKMIDDMKGAGENKFNPHQDTPLQLAEQLMIDLTTSKKPTEEGRDSAITGVASITYDDIEDTNKKELASSRWRKKQEEVDRSKQMAYWRMMMEPYMSAQGGRVPSGYNTGGLSNLFRLKNV